MSNEARAKRVNLRTVTGRGGTFEFDVADGAYTVSARAPEYMDPDGLLGAATVTVRDNLAQSPARLQLVKAGSIAGRLVDAESKAPLVGAEVQAFRVAHQKGRANRLFEGKRERSLENGAFKIDRLPPGDYILDITPPATLHSRESAASAVSGEARTYQITEWPHGDRTAPLVLAGGVQFDVGSIALERRSVPTVSVELAGECPRGEARNLSFVQVDGASVVTRLQSSARCGESKRYSLAPGTYHAVTSKSGPEDLLSERASSIVTLGGAAASIRLELRKAVDVVGAVAVEGRSDQQLSKALGTESKITVQLWPVGSGNSSPISVLPGVPAVRAGEDGRFLAKVHASPGADGVEVFVRGLPGGFYVKSIQYNGHEWGRRFALNHFSMEQALKVTLSPKGALIRGKVIDEQGSAVSGGGVVLVPWPQAPGAVYPEDLREQPSAKNGEFAFASLPPGEYRVVAVSGAIRGDYEKPHRMMALLDSAPGITVAEGGEKSTTIAIASR